MKYLLLDHAGVLSQALENSGEINESIINKLNNLVQDYDYKILFHSSNNLVGQYELLKRLRMGCIKKNLTFPPVEGIAVRDLVAYPNVSSDEPTIMEYQGLKVAAFGVKKEGKACIREALSILMGANKIDPEKSVVFDDDFSHIEQARKEGYETKYIGGASGLTFEAALDEVLSEQQ